MRPILKICLPMLLTLTLLLLMLPVSVPSVKAADAPNWTKYPLIAHALGGIDGVDYTNSLQAYVQNYDKGQRVFEVDLSLTADGQLAARHDWMGYLAQKFDQNIPANEMDKPLTLSEFKSYKILDKYTPISFDDLARILNRHPDVYIITDTKETDLDLVKKQFTLIRDKANKVNPAILDRLIPEIHSPEMMDTVKQIIPFKNVIFSTYLTAMEPDEIVDYVKKNGIRVVAMPVERVSDDYIANLTKVGAVAYVHTVNDPAQVKKLMDIGVHGIYSDFLTYKDIGIDPAPLYAAAAGAEANEMAVSVQAAGSSAASEAQKLEETSLPAQVAAAAATSAASGQQTAQAPRKSAWESIKSLFSEIITAII